MAGSVVQPPKYATYASRGEARSGATASLPAGSRYLARWVLKAHPVGITTIRGVEGSWSEGETGRVSSGKAQDERPACPAVLRAVLEGPTTPSGARQTFSGVRSGSGAAQLCVVVGRLQPRLAQASGSLLHAPRRSLLEPHGRSARRVWAWLGRTCGGRWLDDRKHNVGRTRRTVDMRTTDACL